VTLRAPRLLWFKPLSPVTTPTRRIISLRMKLAALQALGLEWGVIIQEAQSEGRLGSGRGVLSWTVT